MNSRLSIFDFNENPVRILDQGGEPWFVAADVCRVLEIGNPTEALRNLDEDEKMTLSNPEGRAGIGAQSYNIISESGLYALIFKSRKPQAKAFRKWVTAEVLPAVRQSGRYEAPGVQPVNALQDAITLPDFLAAESSATSLTVPDIVRLGRLCKQIGGAFNIRPGETTDPEWGRIGTWPLRLCQSALRCLQNLQITGDPVLTDLQTLLSAASSNFTAPFTLSDLLQMGFKLGLRFQRPLTRASLTDPNLVKSLGRRLQHSRGRQFTNAQGRVFTVGKTRTRHGARFTINFIQP